MDLIESAFDPVDPCNCTNPTVSKIQLLQRPALKKVEIAVGFLNTPHNGTHLEVRNRLGRVFSFSILGIPSE